MRCIVLLLCLTLPVTAGAATKLNPQPEDIDSITIMAPSGMAVPVSEICKIYSIENRKDVNAVFDSAANNIENIEDGDPADIVIIPSRKWLQSLDSKGLIDDKSVKFIAGDNLVIAASKFMSLPKAEDARTALDNIYNKTLLVTVDDETDALGEYTTQALLKLNLWEKFHARSVIAPTSSSAVDLIIKGQSAGVVFASGAKLYNSKLNIIAIIPESMHKRIEYLGALVVGEDMAEAKDFLNFLASDTAKHIFKKYGFVVE